MQLLLDQQNYINMDIMDHAQLVNTVLPILLSQLIAQSVHFQQLHMHRTYLYVCHVQLVSIAKLQALLHPLIYVMLAIIVEKVKFKVIQL